MRRSLRAVLTALVALFVVGLSTTEALAADPVDTAIAALQQTSVSVYVEPGATGTGTDTTSYIQGFLKSGDHIVIVVLNQSSLSSDAAAQKILDALPAHSVLGLYVNGQFTAYSNLESVPVTAANTAMENARAISMNPPETLATFTRLVHQYQTDHPAKITVTSTTATPTDSSTGIVVGGGVGLALAIIAAVVVVMWRRRRRPSPDDTYVLKASPSNVRDQLVKIRNLIPQIKDQAVASNLRAVIKDTEAFFARSVPSSKHDTDVEAADFRRMLTQAVDMLGRYIDIQDNERYYDNPRQLLASGTEAVEGLAAGVLAAVKRDNTKALLDYQANGDILEAKRYR